MYLLPIGFAISFISSWFSKVFSQPCFKCRLILFFLLFLLDSVSILSTMFHFFFFLFYLLPSFFHYPASFPSESCGLARQDTSAPKFSLSLQSLFPWASLGVSFVYYFICISFGCSRAACIVLHLVCDVPCSFSFSITASVIIIMCRYYFDLIRLSCYTLMVKTVVNVAVVFLLFFLRCSPRTSTHLTLFIPQ